VTARTDVLLALVDLEGDLGQPVDGIVGKAHVHAFRLQQRHILFGQRGLRLGQDAHEVVLAQRAQLHADGEAALQLGIRSLGLARWNAPEAMNRMWSVFTVPYLVDTLCLPPAAAGRAARPRADVATTHVATALGHLVDLVDEHDAVLLAGLDRRAADVVLVDQLAALPRSAAGARP
jgi:hypothetical protein